MVRRNASGLICAFELDTKHQDEKYWPSQKWLSHGGGGVTIRLTSEFPNNMRENSSIFNCFLKVLSDYSRCDRLAFLLAADKPFVPFKGLRSARTNAAKDPKLGNFAVSVPSQRSRNQPCGALKMASRHRCRPCFSQACSSRSSQAPRLECREGRLKTPEAVPVWTVERGIRPGGQRTRKS